MKTTELKIVVASALLFVTASAQALQPEVLYAFQNDGPTNANGANPEAGLVLGNDGHFYGTTYRGGSGNYGTVFKVTTDGLLTTLVSLDHPNGGNPDSGLVLGSDGHFYGTTTSSPGNGRGTVFKVTTNGMLTTLVSFAGNDSPGPGELVLGNDGNLYGTAYEGGGNNQGRVFKVATNGVVTTVVSFTGDNSPGPGELVLGSDGNFYGTSALGSVFKVTTNGVLTSLVSFGDYDGMFPSAALVLGSDGNFYGTTRGWPRSIEPGGIVDGTVFKVTPNGVLTTLAVFDRYTSGTKPRDEMVFGRDGKLYGTTYYGGTGTDNGGASGPGTVFQVTTNGVLTTLVSFTGSNGANPNELVLGHDGNFYGTTANGGPGGGGTIFRLVISAFTRVAKLPGGSMVLTGTGPANGSYRLLANADLSLPIASWTLLTSASFDSNGNFSYTDAGAATNNSRFYQLSVP